ncbi:MAG TPA: hypothetical protein VF096_02160 [Azonexus sp.]
MKFRVILPLLFVLLLGPSVPAAARDGWREMAPEERREMRQQMREHWHQERGMRDDGERGRRGMEPDERRRLRDDMREHRGRGDDYGRRGPRRD